MWHLVRRTRTQPYSAPPQKFLQKFRKFWRRMRCRFWLPLACREVSKWNLPRFQGCALGRYVSVGIRVLMSDQNWKFSPKIEASKELRPEVEVDFGKFPLKLIRMAKDFCTQKCQKSITIRINLRGNLPKSTGVASQTWLLASIFGENFQFLITHQYPNADGDVVPKGASLECGKMSFLTLVVPPRQPEPVPHPSPKFAKILQKFFRRGGTWLRPGTAFRTSTGLLKIATDASLHLLQLLVARRQKPGRVALSPHWRKQIASGFKIGEKLVKFSSAVASAQWTDSSGFQTCFACYVFCRKFKKFFINFNLKFKFILKFKFTTSATADCNLQPRSPAFAPSSCSKI